MTYHVIVSSAQMPASVKARYERVAILECEPGYVSGRIDDRPRGVRRIVRLWDRRHRGNRSTGNSAAERAYAYAVTLADQLNARDTHEAIGEC